MRVAAAQLAPAFLQRDATLDKVCAALGEAAANGAQLVAFPETFVPGYPAWADFTDASIGHLLAQMLQNSLILQRKLLLKSFSC